MIIDTFSNRLQKAMTIRNMKSSEIEKRSELLVESNKIEKVIKMPMITDYLKGKYKATQKNVYALSLILNVDEAWLLGADVPMNAIKLNQTTPIFLVPVIGRVPAGEPLYEEENIEKYIAIPQGMYNVQKNEEIFFLKVNGNSMNKLVQDGAYVLIHEQSTAENGDIVVARVNNDNEVTLKKYKVLDNNFVMLEPQSTMSEYTPIIINLAETNLEIIGKVIGDFKKW